MEKVCESKYMVVLYDKSLSLGLYRWKSENLEMKDNEYQSEMLRVLKEFSELKPVNVLADIRDSEFVVLPELQIWLNENVIAKIVEVSMKRLFLLLKDNLIQQLNYEQIIDEDKTKAFQTFYLNDEAKVFEWLRNNKND